MNYDNQPIMDNRFKLWFLALATTVLIYACSPAEGNFGGSEYMPDMGHSVAVEANTYDFYSYNTWDDASTIKLAELMAINRPVNGTMPFGYAGVALSADAAGGQHVMDMMHGATALTAQSVPVNGHTPYYYADTEEERLRATAEIVGNPFPITAGGLKRGEELYNIFCGVCHGVSGNGLGYIYNEEENPNAKYPAAPANFLSEQFLTASNGRYYHGIIYGKNVMGGYSDKLSYEERWQVIHWIRALQAKELKLQYDEVANTLNPLFGTPASQVQVAARQVTDNEPAPGETQPATHSTTSDQHGGGSH